MLRTRSPRKEKISNCYLHSNSLSNKMDNSLLAVRDINHKYIVVDGRKDFDFHQQIICDICGKYGRFQVFMTYTVLSLFFIPCFKWNKHYYVQTSCCNTVYELDAEIGKRIAAGDDMEILPQHLRQMNQQGYGYTMRHCRNCGFSTTEDFEYCPKCGTRLSE